MAALTNNDLNIAPYVDYDAKKLRIRDLVTYPDFDLLATQVKGCYTAEQLQTTDVFYNNTNFNSPDVQPNVSQYSSAWVDFPIDTLSMEMLTGDFTIDYRVRVTFSAVNISEVQGAPANVFTIPQALLEGYVPYVGMTIVTTGNLASQNNGTFVVTGVETGVGVYTIQVANTLVDEEGTPGAQMSLWFDFSKEFTFCLKAFTKPVGVLSLTYSCASGQIVVTDDTNAGNPTSSTRVLTYMYPNALGDQKPANVVTAASKLIVGPPIWTKTSTATLSLTNEYEYVDGVVITTVISTTKEVQVVCYDICCLIDGVYKIRDKYVSELNNASRSSYQSDLLTATSTLTLISRYSSECPDSVRLDVLVEGLKKLLKRYGCECDCGCSADNSIPQKIDPSSAMTISAENVTVAEIEGITATNLQEVLEEIWAAMAGGIPVPDLPFAVLQSNEDGQWVQGFSILPGETAGQTVVWDGSKYVPTPALYNRDIIEISSTVTTNVDVNIVIDSGILVANGDIVHVTVPIKGSGGGSILTVDIVGTKTDASPFTEEAVGIVCQNHGGVLELYLVKTGASYSVFYQIQLITGLILGGVFASAVSVDYEESVTINLSWSGTNGVIGNYVVRKTGQQ